jgi:hypothetical protein
MIRLLLCALALCTSLMSYGQTLKSFTSRDTALHYYLLNSDQLEFIHKDGKIRDTIWFFQKPSLMISDTAEMDVDPDYGAYIKVSSIENEVKYTLTQVLPFEIVYKKIGDDIILYLKSERDDDYQELIANASIRMVDKPLHYDSSYGGYLISFKDLSNKKLAKYFIIELDGKSYIQTFQYQSSYNYDHDRYYNHRHNYRKFPYGYTIMDKPKYKLGDSLRFKAFLLNIESLQALEREVFFKVYDNHSNKNVLLTSLKPTTPGSYIYNWQIPDSLAQDRSYSILIGYVDGSNRVYHREHKFKIESYNLEKTNISFVANKTNIRSGENLEFTVNTVDANNLPIGNVRLQFVASIYALHNLRGDTFRYGQNRMDSFLVVDTVLPYARLHKFILDYNKLPKADCKIRVQGSLIDPQFEKKDFEIEADYSADTSELIFIQSKDSVIIRQLVYNRDVNKKFLVKRYTIDYDVLDSHWIETPYKAHLDYTTSKLVLKDNDSIIQTLNIFFNKLEMVHLIGSKNPREMKISFKYPFKQPVYYRIYKGKDIVKSGCSNQLDFIAIDSSLKTYSILLGHNYNGEIEKNFYRIYFYPMDKKLNIKANFPTKVYPGQKLNLDFEVTNWKGEPVKDFNLASYGVNNQFKDHINEPYIDVPEQFKIGVKSEEISGEFKDMKNFDLDLKSAYTITPRHVETFSLYRNEFYKLLFPKNGMNILEIPKQKSSPEYMVVLSYKGKLHYPKTIKLDNKLQYISHISHIDHSLYIDTGFHSLTIRGFDKVIHLPKIKFSQHFKYLISINIDSCRAIRNRGEIILTDSLNLYIPTENEQREIESSVLMCNGYKVDSILTILNTSYTRNYFRFSNNEFKSLWIGNTQFNVLGPFDFHNAVLKDKEEEHILSIGRYLHYYTEFNSSFETREMDVKSKLRLEFSDKTIHFTRKLTELLEPDTLKSELIYTSKNHTSLPSSRNENDFELNKYVFNDFKNATDVFKVEVENSKNLIKGIWIINRNNKFLSQFATVHSYSFTLFSSNGNHPVDIFLFGDKGQVKVLRNIIIPSNHVFHINGEHLKMEDIQEKDIIEAINIFHKVTEKPLIPFYGAPDTFHNIKLEHRDEYNIPGRANLFGSMVSVNQDFNNLIVLLEQNGLYRYGARANAQGQFEFLDIPAGIYDIKIYSPVHVLTFYYRVYVGGTKQQQMTAILKSSHNRHPVFESIANNYRVSIHKSKAKSKLNIRAFDRDTKLPVNNINAHLILEEDSIWIKNAMNKNILFNSNKSSYAFEIRHPKYKTVYFLFDALLGNFITNVDIYLDKRIDTIKTPLAYRFWIDQENLVMNTKEEEFIFERLRGTEFKTNTGNGEIHGRVVDEYGQPVPFAIIVVIRDQIGNERTSKGTKADANGYYVLKGMKPGWYNLMATSVGKPASIELEVQVLSGRSVRIDFRMERSNGVKKEVMIMSKGRPSKLIDVYKPKESIIGSEEVKEASTKKIVSIASSTGGIVYEDVGNSLSVGGGRDGGLVYFVDGVKMTGSASVPPSQINQEIYTIAELDRLNEKINQSIDNNFEKELEYMQQLGLSDDLRDNFSDAGYWIPNLMTDKHGKASATVKLPDNLTQWKCFTLGMASMGYYGQRSDIMNAFKPMQVQSYLPYFLRHGDSITLQTKFSNLTESAKQCKLSIQVDKMQTKTYDTLLTEYMNENISITVPEKDSLSYTASLQFQDKYKDVEKHDIPLYSTDLNTFSNRSFYFDKDSSYHVTVAENTKGFLLFNNSMYENVLNLIQELQHYQYGCVEQTASKLKALYYQQKISIQLDRTLNNKKEQTQIARKLADMQNDDGSFGWWRGGGGNIDMTTYAMDALFLYGGGKNHSASKAARFFKKQIKRQLSPELLYPAFIMVKNNSLDVENVDLSKLSVVELTTQQKLLYYKLLQLQGAKIPTFDFYQLILELEGQKSLRYQGNFFNDTKSNIFSLYSLFKGTEFEVEINLKFKNDIENGIFSNNLNTFSKAALIEALLSNEYSKTAITSELILNEQVKIKAFPYIMKLDNLHNLRIKHVGAPVWLNSVEEVSIKNPLIFDSLFSVKTTYTQQDKIQNLLKRGVATKLNVEVYAYQTKEHVMIEIPLPAGVIMKSKPQYYGQDYVEYHYDKIIIFKQNLRVGHHKFSFDIEPLFAGVFQLPPAVISLMYYPHVYGNNLQSKISYQR